MLDLSILLERTKAAGRRFSMAFVRNIRQAR